MAFFQVVAIYLLVKGRVFWASLSLSVALSIKAGAVLMLPVFLGTVQYRFGFKYLIIALFTIFALQIAVAAPFIEQFGGKTTIATYLTRSKLLGGDTDNHAKGRGAVYQYSIFWKFISEEMYNSNEFLIYTKTAIFFLNFWLFVVKQNAIP